MLSPKISDTTKIDQNLIFENSPVHSSDKSIDQFLWKSNFYSIVLYSENVSFFKTLHTKIFCMSLPLKKVIYPCLMVLFVYVNEFRRASK